MRIVNKPWGHEKIWAETSNYVGKILVIESGHRLSKQFHNIKEETFLVIKGVLILEIGDGDNIVTFLMREGESYHCPPGTIHRMSCGSEQATEVAEVSTNHLDDIVRLEDDYQR